MKGTNTMAKEETTQNFEEDSLKFQHLLAEVRAVDNKDKSKILIDAIDNNLKEVMTAICKYSEAGSLTIKLDFGVDKKSRELSVVADISIKKPKGKCKNQFFHNEKGDILMYDPEMTKSSNVVTNIR